MITQKKKEHEWNMWALHNKSMDTIYARLFPTFEMAKHNACDDFGRVIKVKVRKA